MKEDAEDMVRARVLYALTRLVFDTKMGIMQKYHQEREDNWRRKIFHELMYEGL